MKIIKPLLNEVGVIGFMRDQIYIILFLHIYFCLLQRSSLWHGNKSLSKRGDELQTRSWCTNCKLSDNDDKVTYLSEGDYSFEKNLLKISLALNIPDRFIRSFTDIEDINRKQNYFTFLFLFWSNQK